MQVPECLSANLALVAVGGVAGAWQVFAVALFEHTLSPDSFCSKSYKAGVVQLLPAPSI